MPPDSLSLSDIYMSNALYVISTWSLIKCSVALTKTQFCHFIFIKASNLEITNILLFASSPFNDNKSSITATGTFIMFSALLKRIRSVSNFNNSSLSFLLGLHLSEVRDFSRTLKSFDIRNSIVTMQGFVRAEVYDVRRRRLSQQANFNRA